MKKSIFLFFAAILCAIGMNAATVTSDGTARLYFNMKAVSWWNAGTNGNGNFAYFFDNSTGKNAWSAHAVKHSGDTYYVVIPNGTWAGVILTRNNTSTAPSWNNKWNQTGDIGLSSTSNYISKFSEGSATVTWGTAVKPVSDAAVSAASTIFVDASTTLTPSLTSNATINDIKSTTYTISPATGASISGNTFTATAEGTYTITATVTYHPDGYSSLTSSATATTTITAEVLAEETHDVTVSYMCGSTKVAEPTIVNTVGVETSVKVTAPEIAKYTFANWTLGADVATTDALTSNEINIITKTGGSDFTLVANYEKAKLTYTVTVPAGTENCYLVGAMNDWDVENPIEMTKQGENVFTVTLEDVEKTDEYKYISQKGTWDYADVQEANRTWSANDVVTAWKDPLATNLYLRGGMNEWGTIDQFKKEAADAATATVIVELKADTTYEFKVASADWSEGYSSTTAFTATSTQTLSTDVQDNAKLTTVAAGDYTFTWNLTTKKLTVTYPELPKYQVTTTANPAAAGTVEGAGEYEQGKTATLTATAAEGYKFVNWKAGEDVVSTENPYTFNVTADVDLVANFKLDSHTVTVTAENGTVTGADTYEHGAEATLTATPAEGYEFVNWTENEVEVSTDAEYTFEVLADRNLVANFKKKTYTVTATAEHGTVTGADADEYTHGTEITLTATPAEHYVFVNWTAGETVLSTENPYIFTLEADVELKANFALDTHTVAAAAENGTVTGAGTYTHGITATLTATANEHYVFVNWTMGEEVVAETAEYTFTVEADVELVANFKLDSHTVTATATNGTVTGDGTYEHGKEVTLTATADEGYEFVKWSNESTENPLTITVTEDVTISAIFQEVVPVITHTVTWYTAVGETTEVILEEGAAITKPKTNPEMEGYVFMGWTNECFVAEDGSDFTAIEDFGTADADKEYYAVFAKEMTTGGATNKTYSFDITKADFNTTSYAANNTTKTSKATASDGSTLDVQWTSNQVMLQSSAIQFKKNEGYIYNNTDLKNIISVEVTSTAGTFTTYYGTSSQPSNNTSVGSENGYFKIKVGSATGKCSNIKITFAHVTSGEPTTTYSNYMTTCTPEEYTIEWSVNGEVTKTTTVVEGDALVLPEAPAAPDACSDKVFMGWATTATVNTDGSAIIWVDETIIPESDNTYYAVFATEIIDAENSEIESVTLAYAGGTTANMTVDSNNAAIVGLNAEEWSVTAAKGGSNNAPGLNKDNDIRLYYSADGSNTITVSSLVENVTISNITITYTEDKYSNSKVLVNDAVVAGTDGTYTINANSFVITNGNTSNVQVRIKSIVINYTKPSTTYTDYSTICVIPEYTVTFDYSVDAGYIIVNDDRIIEKEVKYAEGTVLTVKALTFDNYRFDAWEDEEGNELVTTPEYTFTVTADVVLKAIITSVPGAVGTGVENNNVVTSETMKVIQNGRLFIIRGGKIYNAQGQVVR